MSDLTSMQGFAAGLLELEVKIFDTRMALRKELGELFNLVDQLPPAMRYEALAKLDGLRQRIG